MSAATARRLTVQGPPLRWSSRDLEDFAGQLYARADVVSKTRSPSERAVLRQKRQRVVYAEAGRVLAVKTLTRALRELEGRRACESGSWTPRAALARELGITSVKLGRWLSSGSVPAEAMAEYSKWAEARALKDLRKMSDRGEVERLVESAKTPEYQHRLPGANAGAPRKFKARAPDLKTGERRTESEEQSGYQWELRVEAWCDFALIDRLTRWALSRERPRGSIQARFWIVTALCAIYDPEAIRGRTGRKKSPGAKREFDRSRDKERGKDLSLNVPISSRTVKHGGLPRAGKLFQAELTLELCEVEQIYVHGLIVRNWRDRNPTERKNYRDRYSDRQERERSQADKARLAKRQATRDRAKKKTLGRRGSAASQAPARVKAPAGARPRKKKR